MKKSCFLPITKLMLMLCFSVLMSSVIAQSKKDIKKNNISTITTWATSVKTGKEKKYKESVEKYDTEGQCIESITYDEFGKVTKHETTNYDSDGNKLVVTEFGSNGKVSSVVTTTYENGLKTKKEVKNGVGELKSRKEYTYE